MSSSKDETVSFATVKPVQSIRSAFPALERSLGGEPVAFFDGPGGTQVPASVVAAMSDYLLNHNANTHWLYPTSVETDQALASARRSLADFVNGSPGEIAFGANMTTLTFHLSRALGRAWGPGDEVLVTELDHHANVDTWRALERERGLRVRSVPMNAETGELNTEELSRLLNPRVKLLAIGAASNCLGTISDVAHAAELAHAMGALVFVDAVHYAPHVLVDVTALGCDFLACSAYKFYGPHIGVLWGRRELIQGLDAPRLVPASSESPELLETGTQNHEGIVGAAAAVDFLAGLAPASGRRAALEQTYEALEARSRVLIQDLWEGLGDIPRVRVFGVPPDGPRTPTIAFVIEEASSEEVAAELGRRGLFLSHGDFYATTVVERLGYQPDGVLRAGCACYTTPEEVARLIAAVADIARAG